METLKFYSLERIKRYVFKRNSYLNIQQKNILTKPLRGDFLVSLNKN
ncbi:hypothetical protein MCERE19_04216 [Spirosomataceae bacterium]